jgi:hypothetical protein
MKKLREKEAKVMEEEEINKKQVHLKNSEFVAYGNEIQLMHVDSKCKDIFIISIGYLTAKKGCADVDKSCNKIELIDRGSQGIYFKIQPRYKYRQEGEKVLFKDQIVLLNTKTNLHLHYSQDKQIPFDEPYKMNKEAWRPSEPDRRQSPSSYAIRYEVNVSTNLERFQILPYHQVDEDPAKKFVKGSQVVRL